jgi:hypothetical protein
MSAITQENWFSGVSLHRYPCSFLSVCWPGDLDIAPETLFDKSTPIAAEANAV